MAGSEASHLLVDHFLMQQKSMLLWQHSCIVAYTQLFSGKPQNTTYIPPRAREMQLQPPTFCKPVSILSHCWQPGVWGIWACQDLPCPWVLLWAVCV